MTGLFQIFDRYRALSRSKSVPKKVTTGSHGQALPGGERDPSCINFAYHMFQDESGHRRVTLAGPERLPQVEATREPRRSSIDNSEVMVAKAPETPKDVQPTVEARPQPPRTSLDSRPKPRLSFYFKENASTDDSSASSSKELPTSVLNVPPGSTLSGSLQVRSSDPTVVATRLSVDGKLSGSEDKEKKSRDFKGMLKGSFKRKGHRGNNQESPGSSGSSFDLKETEQLKKVPELLTERKEGLNSQYLCGQDGLGEDEEYKDFSVFTGSPNGWLESREGFTPRLTVELKAGPQLTRKDDQRILIDDGSRLSDLEDSGEPIAQNDHAPVHLGFKASSNVIDYNDKRNMQRDRARKSVEGRESPGRPFDGKVVTSRFSVDGTAASRQSLGTPRRSVDGRETHRQGPGQNRFAQYVQRSLEASSPQLSLRRENSWANSPGRNADGTWENDMEESRWKASSVVAKLMGLEELPNFDVVSTTGSPMRQYPLLQRGAYYLQSDESPSRDDDDSYQVFGTDEVVTPLRKDTKFMSGVPLALAGRQQATSVSTPPRLQLGSPISPENKGQLTPASPKHLSVSPKHHMIESMPQVLKHQVEQKASSEGLLYSDMDQRLRQLGLKNSIQERKTLKQILEAMHLKGLLQPPRHMDPDWKRNFPRQGSNGVIAKSLFDNKKKLSSSYLGDSLKEDNFGLDYKDIPMYMSAQKAKSSTKSGYIPDDNKSLLRSRSGEASIVVMKPLNTKSASKLALVNAPLDPSLEKEHETVRGTSASRALLASAAPIATLEKDSSVSSNFRTSSRSEASTVSNRLKPRSRSVDSRGQDNVEELPLSVRQRRERIAARTARAKAEGGDILLRDNSKSARSLSPVGKSSAKSSSPARSAFGSSVSQTGDAKSRLKPSLEKKSTKSTTQGTRKAKSSRETLKERTVSDQEVTRVLNRNKLDSTLLAGDVEKIAHTWSKADDAAEVAVLHSKRSGRGGSNDQSNSALLVDEKEHLEEPCREFLDSAADSCSESLDLTLERSRNGSPVNVISPTFTSFESRSSRHSRHSSEKSLDGFYDIQERYQSKLEDSELQTDSDAALFTDQGSSDVSMSRESQVDELGLNALDSSEASPLGFLVRRKVHEDRDERLVEGAEQPSPISVLNNINFQEEDSTPSPISEKAGFVSLQAHADCSVSESGEDQEDLKTPVWQPTDPSTPTQFIPALTGDPLKDLIYKVARSLNLDDQNSFLNKPTLEIQVPYVPDLFSATSLNSIPSSFASKEDEKAYVRHIMIASGVTEETTAPREWPQSGQLMTTDFFDQLEEHLELRESARKQNAYLSGEERTEYLKQALDRRLLFDCVNNILERKFYPYYNPQPWGSQTLLKKPTGAKLVEEIWEELTTIYTCALDDDTLYTILQKDFTQRGEKWVDFSVEIGAIGMEIEDTILDELMDATVQEWSDEYRFL